MVCPTTHVALVVEEDTVKELVPIQTRKAVIIGAGRVGSHVALCLMFRHLVNEIVFVDLNKEAAYA
jgi:tRNA A37 threonylcarbamoyladenosine dehydratase